jgi:hypothetical protein
MSADAPISKEAVSNPVCETLAFRARFLRNMMSDVVPAQIPDSMDAAVVEIQRLTAERDQYKQRLTEAQQLAIRQGNQLRQMAGAAMRKQS